MSHEQARALAGLNVLGTIHHAVDTEAYTFQAVPDDYLLFLGRFTEGKGVLQAIEVARRTGHRLMLAAKENDYYREHVAPLVDGAQVIYAGEVRHAEKVALLGGARALLYPVQSGESFGLVLAEAAACGTPIAALRRGAVSELRGRGDGRGVRLTRRAGGRPAAGAGARSRGRARRVPWSDSASPAWSRPTWTLYRGVAERHRARA